MRECHHRLRLFWQRGCACLALGLWLCSCQAPVPKYPWSGDVAPTEPPTPQHALVRTVNDDYSRTRSHVLVREVARPTRAALDYAAYHANFMIAAEPPEVVPEPAATPDIARPFDGMVERETLTADLRSTPLTAAELSAPLSFSPLSDYLLAHKVPGAEALEELGSAVRSESWGGGSVPGLPSQSISEVYLHGAAGATPELWAKIELAPWFRGLGPLPDQDRDGYPEVYGRARADRLSAQVVETIQNEYTKRLLSEREIRTWANELSSYWYPSFNTDLVAPGPSWPDAQTEPAIQRELRGLSLTQPTIVLRGKPQGLPTYEVFVIPSLRATPAAETTSDAHAVAAAFEKQAPSPETQAQARAMQAELERSGTQSWQSWSDKLAPFAQVVRKHLEATPAALKGLVGDDGYLFYRNALELVVGGDLEAQPVGKNPLPVIVEWKQRLAQLGVDFVFVPVPAKVEVYPDKLDKALASYAGQIVDPWERKLVASLAAQGVEVLDLHAPLLAARAQDATAHEPLYQRQDTHWSARGLELAAEQIARRVQRYPWFAQLAARKRTYHTRDASFSRFGDLHSRLSEAQKRHYRPETLPAHQVLREDDEPYENDPESPIVVLGDSFTGVYELTDAEHAGVSAHLARAIGHPVDLVMSYGGGPNVRHKLMRRGEQALQKKQLVIWIMADRDLYNHWEDWEPLHTP